MTRRYFASVPRIQPHTPPELLPVCMTAVEVAAYTRQSYKYLLSRVRTGKAKPMPVVDRRGLLVKPYRWHRDTVRQWVEGAKP